MFLLTIHKVAAKGCFQGYLLEIKTSALFSIVETDRKCSERVMGKTCNQNVPGILRSPGMRP